MKSGLAVGQTAQLEITVTPDMMATFGDQLVHELYCTSALVHHMEWSCRKLIVPYMEAHEEAMGYHVEVSHLSMTLPGMSVKLKATLTEIRDRKVICDVEAFNGRSKLSRGTVTLALVEKPWLNQKINELTIINQLAGQLQTSTTNNQIAKETTTKTATTK